MIGVESFFSGTMNTVDAVIGNYVNTAYTNFVSELHGLITLAFTVYVMFLGYKQLTHTLDLNMNLIVRQLVVMVCVYGLVMNWNLYNLFIYQVFTAEPAHIAQVLTKSTGVLHSKANIAESLDEIYESVVNISTMLFGKMSFSVSGINFLFYGLMVYVIGSLTCIFALLLFIYAKMMMAISLALGPIFILFILWEPTKGLFSAWLNKLITIALIPVVTSAILVLMLSVIKVTLPDTEVQPEDLQFYGISPFLGLCITTMLILSQVFKICSSLGGGITLASISAGGHIVSSSLRGSGISSATRAVRDWSMNKVGQGTKKRILRGGK